MPLKILLVQMKIDAVNAPHARDNIPKADALLAREFPDEASAKRAGIELIVFPEMSFTKYLFSTKEEAEGYECEGVSIEYSKRLAARFAAHVAVGFIRRDEESGALRNSMAVVNPNGEVVLRYDKTFLYDADKVWSSAPPSAPATERRREGWDFPILALGEGRRCIFGICMDINSRDFVNMEAKPLGNDAVRKKADVVVLMAAWCSAHPLDAGAAHDAPIDQAEVVDYWTDRLSPLLVTRRDTIFVCADRVGRETIPRVMAGGVSGGGGKRLHYCGTTCAISLREMKVIDSLDAENEGVLVVQVS